MAAPVPIVMFTSLGDIQLTAALINEITGAPAVASGTFVMNGATPVVVAATEVTSKSQIAITLKTVGGTPAAFVISSITPGTGFDVTGTAGDTSTYNYTVTG